MKSNFSEMDSPKSCLHLSIYSYDAMIIQENCLLPRQGIHSIHDCNECILKILQLNEPKLNWQSQPNEFGNYNFSWWELCTHIYINAISNSLKKHARSWLYIRSYIYVPNVVVIVGHILIYMYVWNSKFE